MRGPVVIVEPDPALRRILRLVLEGGGYECVAAASASDAVGLVERHRPSLVLAEVDLAEGGGQDLARALSGANGWRPRVAIMSAYPRPRRGHEDYFIAKPIEFDRLLHLIESLENEQAR